MSQIRVTTHRHKCTDKNILWFLFFLKHFLHVELFRNSRSWHIGIFALLKHENELELVANNIHCNLVSP